MKFKSAAITFLVVVAASGVAATSSAANPSTPAQPRTQVAGASAPEIELGDVEEALTALKRFEGFGKVSVDYDKSAFDVYWVGEPPEEAQRVIAEQPQGVPITVRAAEFSAAELMKAAEAASLAMGPDREKYLAAVVVNDGLDGVTMELVAGAPQQQKQAAFEQRQSESAGVPVSVEMVKQRPEMTTRQNDWAPHRGGGALANAAGNDFCTVGFSVILNGTTQGRLVTARHCTNAIGQTMRDGVGQPIGPVVGRAPAYDSALIDPTGSPGTIGRVYGGAWNATSATTSRFVLSVAAAGDPADNSEICTSGARSGEHCDGIVVDPSVRFACNPSGEAYRECTGWRAHKADRVLNAGGNSGGPAYYDRASDNRVGARGIITASSVTTACGSTAEPATCYEDVYAIHITDVLTRWDAHIETHS
jgi:hypothetical protein